MSNVTVPPGRGEVVIYKAQGGKTGLEVKLEQGTVWLTQKQIAQLFAAERSVITKHLNNIFASGELSEKSNVQKMHIAGSDKPVHSYNLDAVISVGYRVNSIRATQFRIWATRILKEHLVRGYTLNENRLREHRERFQELQRSIDLIKQVAERKALSSDEASALLNLISDYSYALDILDAYDHERLKPAGKGTKTTFRVSYDAARRVIEQLKEKFGASQLFGREKDASFKSSLASVFQTFGGKDLYPSLEEKAAHLLYFIVKNHSFVDGNKRIAAAVFLWFLERNKALYRPGGGKRIADNALVALTLLMAESDPKDKGTIVTLAVNLINRRNV